VSEVRAFIAIPLPGDVKAGLMDARHALKTTYGRSARWVGPENLHLTLKFLGNTPEEQLASLEEGMSRSVAGTGSFTLCLDRLGAFPSVARPRVFWAGLGGELDRLESLYSALEKELVKRGVAPDRRRFAAHITIGRVREGASVAALPGIELQRLGFTAKEVVLFRSTLKPGGPLYTPLTVSTIGGIV